MNRLCACRYVAVSFILSEISVPAHSALPSDEVERLKLLVLTPFADNDDVKKFPEARATAFAKASSGEAYEVFEIALNGTNLSIRNAALHYLGKVRMPEFKKREILLNALQNPSIWPESMMAYSGRNGMAAMAIYDFQWGYCKALSEAFHTTVDPVEFEKRRQEPAFRNALAKKLGWEGAVPVLGNPDDSSRVWPPKAGEASIPLNESGSATGSVAVAGDSTPLGKLPGGWPLWSGIAAVLAAAAGWIFLRTKGKKG